MKAQILAQQGIDLFTKAIAKLQKSNEMASTLITDNVKVITSLTEENKEASEIIETNTTIIKNINGLLGKNEISK